MDNNLLLILVIIIVVIIWSQRKEGFDRRLKKELDLYCYPEVFTREGDMIYKCGMGCHRPPSYVFIPRASPTPKGVDSILQHFY